jgi:hypothetical protein
MTDNTMVKEKGETTINRTKDRATPVNKVNNHLSPQIIEHIKDHDICRL